MMFLTLWSGRGSEAGLGMNAQVVTGSCHGVTPKVDSMIDSSLTRNWQCKSTFYWPDS